MDAILRDVGFTLRTARKSPGFFAASVLTIALGIGATTAIVTVLDRILLRPLPFPDSERAFLLCETNPRVGDVCVASPPNAADWAASVPALEAVGVARSESAVATLEGRRFGLATGIATAGFFKTLGIHPQLGRLLEESDLAPGRNSVVVLTDALWRQEWNGRAEVIGTFVMLDDRPFQIIGVLPREAYVPTFDFVQAWRPITTSVDDTSKRDWRGFMAIGKLARGATRLDLTRQLDVVHDRLAAAFPDANATWGVRTVGLREHLVGPISATLWVFLGAALLVLAIACVNVANLILVRASTRTVEFAVRASLGAGRGHLVRLLLTESCVIAATGGTAGWLLALAATRVLVAIAPGTIPRLDEVQVDARVALFAIALTSVTAIVFGLAPARVAARTGAADAIKASREVEGSRPRARVVLVVVEMALSVLLLIAGGMLTRSFVRLLAWDAGFDREGLGVSWALVPPTAGTTIQAAVATLEEVREQVAALPGVTSVGLGSAGPLFGGVETGALTGRGIAISRTDEAPVVNWFDIDSHYFGALGRRLVRGRNIAPDDVAGAPQVAVVNETLAAQFFPNDDGLGHLVTVQDHLAQIVGIVSDVRPTRPDRAPAPEIFWPIRQYPRFAAYLVIRMAPGIASLEPAIKAKAGAIPTVQIGALTPLERNFARTLVSPRFNMLLIGTFALVAMTLATIGVYGVLAFSVASRTREIGLRIALGASRSTLLTAIVGRGLLLTIVGLTLAGGAWLLVGRALSAWLYGVSIADPTVLMTIVAGVTSTALIASYLPARRASRIDPLVALRHD